MKAYFDFFIDDAQMKFENARGIVKKYESYPIVHFRKIFDKIKR